MQCLAVVVDGNVRGLAVQGELTLGDAVAVAAHHGTEVGIAVALVAGDVRMTEHDIGFLAVLVGRDHALDPGAVGDHLDGDSCVLERVHVDGLAVLCGAEWGLGNLGVGRHGEQSCPQQSAKSH